MEAETDALFRTLSARFPDAAGPLIGAVIAEERRRLADRPIQDFVPVLVERAATERLRLGGVPLAPGAQA